MTHRRTAALVTWYHDSGRRQAMAKTLTAIFDGETLRPDEPADLQRDARYRITIESDAPDVTEPSVWDVMESLIGSVDAPEDWSIEHDHYLYGTPKHTPEAAPSPCDASSRTRSSSRRSSTDGISITSRPFRSGRPSAGPAKCG